MILGTDRIDANISVPSRNMKIDYDALINRPVSRFPLAAFWEGACGPWAGLRYMNCHPTLWRYGVIPVILNLIITAVVVVVLAWAAVTMTQPWLADPTSAWHWRVVQWLVVLAILMAAGAGAFILWIVLQGVLCGHFYGKLAEQVESQIGIGDDEIREIPIMYQVVDTTRDTGFLIMANLACLLVQLVPGVGSVLGLVGGFYFNCAVLGMEYLDYPLALRGLRLKEKRAFVRHHRAHALGLGAVVAAVTFIPILGSILLTTATTGAVILHRRLRAWEETQAGMPG